MFRFYYVDVQMHSFSNSLDLEVDSKIVFYNNNNNNNCAYVPQQSAHEWCTINKNNNITLHIFSAIQGASLVCTININTFLVTHTCYL